VAKEIRRMHTPLPSPTPPRAVRFIFALFGFIFAGIGLTVIIFIWSEPFGGFGSPPLFFRIFGSFIAVAFIGFGAAMAISAIIGNKEPLAPSIPAASVAPHAPASTAHLPGRYACSRCAAPLADNAQVSPLGDARCPHCGSWFNIHGRSPS
jgi:DNA-directed RNA polymerase subunit RPC12/RpoP